VLRSAKNSAESTAKVDGVLEKVYREAQAAMEAELDGTTLSQLTKRSEKKKK
jgi:DNA-binding IscR family transcriptional regulator